LIQDHFKKNQKRGFSLPELIIAAALMSVVLGVGYRFFMSSQRSYKQGDFKYKIQHEAQKLMEYVKLDLLHSCKKKIDDPTLYTLPNGYWFYRFSDPNSFSGDHPVMERVDYTLDVANQLVTRTITTATDKGSMIVGKSITGLKVVPYFLNKRYYFRVEVVAAITGVETRSYGLKVELRTSVESRFENNTLNHAGWIDNPHTIIQ
jgi:prepilin-type N-terminal cleavage/methylation domain-containing protein